MKQTFTSLLIIFLSILAFKTQAQSDFRKGFIINHTNDTTFGYIDYRGNILNSKICSFKATHEDNMMQYTSDDLKGYGFFNDKFYQSEVITSEMDTAKAFIEVLVKGNLNLYYFRGRFFIRKAGQNLIELKDETVVQYKNERRFFVKLNEHIRQLATLTYDCPIPTGQLERLRLNQKELTTIVENYNDCIAAKNGITYKASKPWKEIQLGALAGISLTNLSFTSENEQALYLSEAEFIHKPSPTIGAFINVHSPRINERLSLQLEALYNQDKFIGYSDVVMFNTRSRNEMKLEFSKIHSAFLAQYTYPQYKIRPFVGAGVAGNFLLSSKTERAEEQYSEQSIWMNYTNVIDISERYLSFLAVVGGRQPIAGKMFANFELRYEWSRQSQGSLIVFGPMHNTKSHTHTLTFLIGLGI